MSLHEIMTDNALTPEHAEFSLVDYSRLRVERLSFLQRIIRWWKGKL
jgi:hypothetical protein